MNLNGYVGKKASKPQPVSKRLASRVADYESFVKTVDSKLRQGYHCPGSQQN